MLTVYLILAFLTIGAVFLVITLHRHGGRQLAQPHPKHSEILKRIRSDELALAYNLALTNLTLSREFNTSRKRISAEIEVARSLFTELKAQRGSPITVSEKAKLKLALTRLAVSDTLRRRTEGDYSDLALRVDQDVDTPENEEQLYGVINDMLNALA